MTPEAVAAMEQVRKKTLEDASEGWDDNALCPEGKGRGEDCNCLLHQLVASATKNPA
jgi:hypothetical protein